jgi:hypothetical protein
VPTFSASLFASESHRYPWADVGLSKVPKAKIAKTAVVPMPSIQLDASPDINASTTDGSSIEKTNKSKPVMITSMQSRGLPRCGNNSQY